MKGAPRSTQFDDIYFSAENGLEETAHVFLHGNDLPAAWQGRGQGEGQEQDQFTICETGFGTGLNFLSVWKLFEETAEETQTLDFISVEKYPLKAEEIKNSLAPWAEYFGLRIDILLEKYPLRIAGFHRVKINQQITLTLLIGDVAEELPRLEASVDCWFLDGFTPAKNPDMWNTEVFAQMARLSKEGASYATYTAAGDVRRGLAAAGFSVEKQKGFGHKRDMIAGCFKAPCHSVSSEAKRRSLVSSQVRSLGYARDDKVENSRANRKKIAIIGGGLAGTACAYTLKQYGFEPVIYEASDQLGHGASGNSVGLYNPRFSKLRDDLSNFFAPAYAQFVTTAKEAGGAVDYTPCGALHLMNTPEKTERFMSMVNHWQWHEDHLRVVDTKEASDIAGIPIEYEALYLPDSGYLSPKKLCEFYAQDVEVHFNRHIKNVNEIDADAVILACGAAVKNFDSLTWLPIESVRGQISALQETAHSRDLKCDIHYGGYVTPSREGVHMTGSTFEKWIDHLDVLEKDHGRNINTLQKNITFLKNEDFKAVSGRAGMRAATNDRFPVVGVVPNSSNTYVSTAFGSHGLVGSIAGAQYLADLLRGHASCMPSKTAYALSPQRFIDRAAKKGHALV